MSTLHWYTDSSGGEKQNLMIKQTDFKTSWLKVCREFQDCREDRIRKTLG